MTGLLWAVCLLLVIYLFTVRARGAWAAPDALFVLFNVVTTVGTLLLVDPASTMERTYAWLMVSGLVLFMSVSWLARVTYRHVPSWSHITVIKTPSHWVVWALYWISLAISIAYYAAIGYINLVEAFSSYVTGSQYDVATQRLASYSGTEYYFPGYVNPFKNAMLPVLTAALIHGFWVDRDPFRIAKTGAMSFVCFVMLAGTGQRGATVMAVIIIGIVLAAGRVIRRATFGWFGAAAFAAFSLLTLLLQRQSEELARASSWADSLSVFGGALWSRVVLENPDSGISAWRYMAYNPVGFGEQWMRELVSLLPGTGSPSLAHQVFGMIYGSERGTAPESVWGGIVYNFGIVGGTLFVVAWAMLLFASGVMLLRPALTGRHIYSLEAFAVAGAAVSLGSWVAGSPTYLFNTGLFAYIFLIWLSRALQGKQRTESNDHGSEPRQHHLGRPQRKSAPRGHDRVGAGAGPQ